MPPKKLMFQNMKINAMVTLPINNMSKIDIAKIETICMSLNIVSSDFSLCKEPRYVLCLDMQVL